MTISIRRPFIAIGPQQARLEVGWFDGATTALVQLAVFEWQHEKEMPWLSYLCLIRLQLLKFVVAVTIFPDRSRDKCSFEDIAFSGHADCD